ncbi:MAG: hypothetical protein H0U21_08075 [Acidimicrobiia bacterium]|nr:hypothetical protein [Acidimicrobiia bacterium]
MRFARTSLLARLTSPDAPGFIALEGPSGTGKSWLLRKAAGSDVLRLRGELGPLADKPLDELPPVILDDAHLLDAESATLLAERIEDAPEGTRILVAGRLLPDAILEVVQLVDGLMIDASALAVTPEEVLEEAPPHMQSEIVAERMVEITDGNVRVIATALDQCRRDPTADPVAVASRIVRAGAAAAQQRLDPPDNSTLGLLARSSGIDRQVLESLGDDGIVVRLLDAGVPLRRQMTGELDVLTPAAYRSSPVETVAATALAHNLVERGQQLEAISLLLDAGARGEAATVLMDLSVSLADTVEPRDLLGLLARLGAQTEQEPLLLLLRANASRDVGRVADATVDIERAVELAADGPGPLRRRVGIEAAKVLLDDGRREEAQRLAEEILAELPPDEGRTFAGVHELLAITAGATDSRDDLQRAAEHYSLAISAWEGCGEFAMARTCRRDLVIVVLVPLGRLDEALAQLGHLLATPELSDAERTWTVLFEGFVLLNANRLESAESRFVRVAEVGRAHENPRLVAAAAWGRMVVSARREDLDATLRWITTAENTAMTDADDVLGVPFLCDVTAALGALGELELAGRYLARAHARRDLYPDQLALANFLYHARLGDVGDVDEQLRHTAPAEVWRVQLVAATAAARSGDLDTARRLATECDRTLLGLGFSDAALLGERRTVEELQGLLQRSVGPAPVTDIPVPRPWAQAAGALRVCVIGGTMTVQHDDVEEPIPPGNPQRLVGVVVAHGGSASFDQLSEAIWPGEEVETSRTRLRNVLLRLRRAVGDVVVRSGSGVRFGAGVTCDLIQFERLAVDALSAARADPEMAGRLAAEAVRAGEGAVFADFEYEEWAIAARRAAEQRMIDLFDLLSVQAEDDGDLQMAQALAERALRLDRHTDSRYLRLAELLARQDRAAAAIAVLDEGAEVAREIGGALPPEVTTRRNSLLNKGAVTG